MLLLIPQGLLRSTSPWPEPTLEAFHGILYFFDAQPVDCTLHALAWPAACSLLT
jgi:hypothetical protein